MYSEKVKTLFLNPPNVGPREGQRASRLARLTSRLLTLAKRAVSGDCRSGSSVNTLRKRP